MIHLPVNKREMLSYGWNQLDFLIISGDAYVDHPSFAPALLGRLLESAGYRAGIIPQPSVNSADSLLAMGRPRLAVLIAPGAVDSMVNNYTAAGKPRSEDRYSAGGLAGNRPDRAVIRYCNLVREQLGEVPLVIGGIEASLRRFAHYDYWSGKVRRSILQDSRADLLVFGMGEQPLLELAGLLDKGVPINRINSLRGTCVLRPVSKLPGSCADFITRHENVSDRDAGQKNPDDRLPRDREYLLLPSYEEVAQDKPAYALAARHIHQQQDPGDGLSLIQRHGRRYLLQNPPSVPLTETEMDRIYSLRFTRTAHPMYAGIGQVPALTEVSFSITAHRGCFGGCHFCAITMHQGRIIQKRSRESILAEVDLLTGQPDFKGYIHDIGGPTANFHRPVCRTQEQGHVCRHRQCLFPHPCPSIDPDHGQWLETLRLARQRPGVKKVFIRSGIRFDYLLEARDDNIMREICRHHVSGQLKVAPEHICPEVLQAMGKPAGDYFERFTRRFSEQSKKLGLKQYLVPYWMSGHPGCTLEHAVELALAIKAGGVIPEQVQDFYPTPGTISTAMYYTGINPLDLQPIHVPDAGEKAMQRALLQFNRPENRQLVLRALRTVGRGDLIGGGSRQLVTDSREYGKRNQKIYKKENRKQEGKKHAYNHQRQGTGGKTARRTGGENQRPGKNRRTPGTGSNPGR